MLVLCIKNIFIIPIVTEIVSMIGAVTALGAAAAYQIKLINPLKAIKKVRWR